MADKRNRSLAFVEFLQSEGITVNVAKNKAWGHKGFFKAKDNSYRIDIAKGLSDYETLRVLLHEFAHYLHFKYDKNLSNLDFIIKDLDNDILEEMIKLTVDLIPQGQAKELFNKKEALNVEIKNIANSIKTVYPDFKLSTPNKKIENVLQKKGLSLLVKYDKVKVLNGFRIKLLTIENVDKYFSTEDLILKQYLLLKSKQRYLKRINTRINKLNRYYNSLTELFARSIEIYFLNSSLMNLKAPKLKTIYDNVIAENMLPSLTKCLEFFT